MSATSQHLANAKDYIARGEDYYRKAADEILAAMREDPTMGERTVAAHVGRSRSWVKHLVQWRTSGLDQDQPPFGGAEQNEARYDRQVRTALKDPERRQQAIAALPTEQVEQVIQQAHDVVVSRIRAQRAEQDDAPKPPTINDLTGGQHFDPSESWADLHITRVWDRAHALRQHIEKWGLVLGSMTDEQAFDDLQRAERDVAEVRAALQERIRDRLRQEV